MNLPDAPNPLLIKVIALLLLLLALSIRGEVTVDSKFAPELGSYPLVNSIALQSDGKVVVGGDFSTHIARFNADGSLDTSFTAKTDGSVTAVSLSPSGEILIGGRFSSVDGARHPSVARLQTNGTVDSGFSIGYGANGAVNSLVLRPNGDLLVGGCFTTLNGQPFDYLSGLATDGSSDPSFNAPFIRNNAIEAGVSVLAPQADGKVLVGGIFDTASGFESLVRLETDGSLDSSFLPNHGAILYLNAVATLLDGKILIGGMATSKGDGFVRQLLANGQVDSSFPEVAFDGPVQSLYVTSAGKIVVGGDFDHVGEAARSNLARLNADASLDSTFEVSVSGPVQVITGDGSSAIYIGGAFDHVSGQPVSSLVRLIDHTGPTLHSSSTGRGTFTAHFQAEVGKTYVIEASSDLGSWSAISTVVATTNLVAVEDGGSARYSHRFFRARIVD